MVPAQRTAVTTSLRIWACIFSFLQFLRFQIVFFVSVFRRNSCIENGVEHSEVTGVCQLPSLLIAPHFAPSAQRRLALATFARSLTSFKVESLLHASQQLAETLLPTPAIRSSSEQSTPHPATQHPEATRCHHNSRSSFPRIARRTSSPRQLLVGRRCEQLLVCQRRWKHKLVGRCHSRQRGFAGVRRQQHGNA